MRPLPRPCLCLVTDRRRTSPDSRTSIAQIAALERLLDEAIDAGIDLIQIRERDLEARELLALARRIDARARGTATRLVVNDRADVALSTAGAGVHLRSDGPPAAAVRELFGPDRLIGSSVHVPTPNERAAGADYLIFGTVFPTVSKPDGTTEAGPAGLKAATGAIALPVLAIGGVTPGRAAVCRDAGATGIAAIGAFLPAGAAPEAVGPRAALVAFRAAWETSA